MSFLNSLEGALNKGKAKLKEYTDGKNSQPQQPQHHQQQYYPPPHQPQPHQYNPPGQFQQWQQEEPYHPPQPSQPPYQNSPLSPQNLQIGGPPPIPSWSKPPAPQTPQPPIPSSTRPSARSPPYWQPLFDASLPISTYFIQETGDHGWGNNEKQNYTNSPANCFFTPHQQLVLRGIVNTFAPNNRYTSARLISQQKLSRQRGYLSATLKAPCAPGIWPAFWALPAEPFTWPNDGEVDIFESWNGDCVNHSCLHWGHYNGEDWNKHRVVDTYIPDMPQREVMIGFAWTQDEDRDGAGGRMVWYLDGRPVMKAIVPAGTRRVSDYRVIMNVAMGGNVCQGKLPADGVYDFVVRELAMWDTPAVGWDQFHRDFDSGREGKTM
ncbi:concanavalin A-like lectin/glucanase domain-containing protein [Amylocarpus encephaloides]|uniref:Concanavalin A-like lectin/glucanase domain-containing protein n=1 Tax=Amylocarpus encephaloides TaxID=45428 RepID=A0A9P8C5H2_9HELO|nr:concanavalin A-like lectin/glucanase domain-containing protein [Amylocarpus encephaloides]